MDGALSFDFSLNKSSKFSHWLGLGFNSFTITEELDHLTDSIT